MNEQLKRIREKLSMLARLDKKHTLFGSTSHKYRLNPPINLREITKFEKIHKVELPKGYVQFLTQLGNGGAGAYYGLEPFAKCLLEDLSNPEFIHNPSLPFPHTQEWNLEFQPTSSEEENEHQFYQELEKFEEEYFHSKHNNGVISIAHFGCGVIVYLVVNGAEYGHIWFDDRGCYNGIYPTSDFGITERITFLDWYERWLDTSLQSIS